MPPRKVALVFWLIVVTLLPLVVLPPFGFVHWPHDREIVSVAALGILVAILWRALMSRRHKRLIVDEQHRRYGELKRAILTTGQAVPVDGASGIGLLIVITGLFALAVWGAVAQREPMVVGGAVLLALFVFLAAVISIPAIGRPVLVLSRQGIQPAGYGPLPWSDIEGIEVTELHTRGADLGHVLRLFVPALNRHLHQAHPLIRLARTMFRGLKMREVVTLRLRRTSEPPALIERLCRDLWKAATGMDHSWSIHFSSAEVQLMRSLAQHRRKDASGEILTDPERDLQRLRNLGEQFQAAAGAQRSRLGWNQLGISSLTTVVGLIIAYKLINLFTNFVASDSWLVTSFWIACGIVCVGCVFFVRHARKTIGDDLHGRRLAGLVASMLAALLLIFPLTWIVLQNLIGDPMAREFGAPAEVSVRAIKTDASRRRGCDERLGGAGVGDPICLTREQFERLPDEVSVTLSVRRSWMGYHVDAHRIDGEQ